MTGELFTTEELRALRTMQTPEAKLRSQGRLHMDQEISHQLSSVFEGNLYVMAMLAGPDHNAFNQLIERGGKIYGEVFKSRGFVDGFQEKKVEARGEEASFNLLMSKLYQAWKDQLFPEGFKS